MVGQKWEVWSGGVQTTLDCACDQAWAIFGDFGGLCKWNPTLTACEIVEGKNNEPGSVRYCKGTRADSWTYERLLVHDKEKHLYKYQMEGSYRFPGFCDDVHGYVSQIQFHDMGNCKTCLDWTYTVEPMATQTYEQFTTFMNEFYLYHLKFLQSAVNPKTSSLHSTIQNDIHLGQDLPKVHPHSRL